MGNAEASAWHEESDVTVLRWEPHHNEELDIGAVCGNCLAEVV